MNSQEIDFETLYRRYAADVYRFALYLTATMRRDSRYLQRRAVFTRSPGRSHLA